MSKREKVSTKTTIKLTDQDKKNIDVDIPRLNQLLASRAVDTSFSKFVRLVSRDLHEALEANQEIVWPPRLERVKKLRTKH
jgi:hypothetical protein